MMDSVGSVVRPGGPEEVSLMAEREIMFIVEGIPGQIPLDVAAEAMSAFTSFLQGTGDTTWALGTLAVGSACFGAIAVGLSREETEARFREIITGMESVDAGAGAPETWSPSALSGLVAMARVADRSGTTGARIVSGETEVRMTRHLAEEARRASAEEIPKDEEARAFYRLSWWRKAIIMACGPMVNLLLAFVFLAVAAFGIGSPRRVPEPAAKTITAVFAAEAEVISL